LHCSHIPGASSDAQNDTYRLLLIMLLHTTHSLPTCTVTSPSKQATGSAAAACRRCTAYACLTIHDLSICWDYFLAHSHGATPFMHAINPAKRLQTTPRSMPDLHGNSARHRQQQRRRRHLHRKMGWVLGRRQYAERRKQAGSEKQFSDRQAGSAGGEDRRRVENQWALSLGAFLGASAREENTEQAARRGEWNRESLPCSCLGRQSGHRCGLRRRRMMQHCGSSTTQQAQGQEACMWQHPVACTPHRQLTAGAVS
jgi:hypothetical protein